MHETESRRIQILLLLTLAAGGVADLVLDAPTDLLEPHALLEIGLIAASVGTATYLMWRWRGTERDLARARSSLARLDAERETWKRGAAAALQGLGKAIDAQFEHWGLTPTEREVALLLLKGHALKEIAAATHRSERTVRQHAVAIYGKSGLAGRAELAGFFLDHLDLPARRPSEPGEAG